MTKIKKLRIAFIALLLVVFSVVGFVVFYQQLRKRSKAAPLGTPELLFATVDNPPMQGDNGIKIAVKINPNSVATELYSFDIEAKFDASKLELKNTGGVDANVTLAPDVLKQSVTLVGTDTIHIVGTKTGSPFTPANQLIADIAFKMKSGSTFPLTFSWGAVTLQVTNFVKVPLTINDNSSSSSSSSDSSGGGVSLSFASSKQTYSVGEEVSIDIMVDTNNQQISSTGVYFSYPANILAHKSTTINTNTFDSTAINGVTPPVVPSTTGTVVINAARKTAISGNLKVATVKFTASVDGTANLAYIKDNCTVYTFNDSPQNILTTVNSYTVTVGTTSSSSSTSSGGSSSSVIPGEQIESNGDILHINSTTFDQAPTRYEQVVNLEKGDYVLSWGTLTYTSRGREVLVVLACGESDCGDGKKLNDVIGQTPHFPLSTTFQRQEVTIHISDAGDKKKYVVRIFVEDGSEADFDYVSLTDIWGGEKLQDYHFNTVSKISSPRKYPDYWEMDMAGSIYGTIDTTKGKDGALYINSSSRQ